MPPVPVRQWVISVPKRLRGVLADRPPAMTALSRIFLDEIERLLCDAAGVAAGRSFAGQARPRLGAVSFQHRFGSALNRHVHLHACVTDGVFERVAAADDVRFHAARPLSPADLIEQPFFCKNVFDGRFIRFPWSGRSAGFPIHH